MSKASKKENYYLIDGSGYIFRAYYALPPLSRKSDGLPTGAVAGFCNMLFKLLEDVKSTAGVDVELRKKLLDNVKSLRDIGVTIILTTHYLSEAEEMCDRIGIINQGNLIALETTENMLNKIQTKIVKFSVNKKVELIDTLKNEFKIIKNNEKELVVSYEKNIINIQEIIDVIKSQEIDIFDVQSRDPDLEDVFISLTNN